MELKLTYLFISVLIATVVISDCASTSKANETNLPKVEWWESAIFYQIYPRSFKDSNGDGIGDLRGVIEKLEHLKELGVAGVWLSPVFKSPMADFGYDVSDFYQIDPMFGTNQDLEDLCREAAKYGIKIILDFVPNHTSNQNEWFEKSVKRAPPYTDYYVWRDGKINSTGHLNPPNNWVSIFYGSSWTWHPVRKQYYYHQFAKEQPDLNYRNPRVHEEMLKVQRFWYDKGVYGFRVDALNHLYEDPQFRDEPLSGITDDPQSYDFTDHIYTIDLPEHYDVIYDWRDFADNYQKEKGGEKRILMTEAYTKSTNLPLYYNSPDNKRQGCEIPFNFMFIMDLGKTATVDEFKKGVDHLLSLVPKGKYMNWVIGNHDRARVGSRFGPQRIDGMLMLAMTLPGIAVTYYGEEIGMLDSRDEISYNDTMDPQACNLPETGNWKEASRDPVRTPFQWDSSKWAGFTQGNTKPWLPVHPNYKDVNLAVQKRFIRSTFKYYKELSALRKEPTFLHGSYESKVINDNVLVYERALKGHTTYVVVINFGAREEIVNLSEVTTHFSNTSEIVVAGADTVYKTGDKVPTNTVFLRKFETVVLKSSNLSSAASVTVSLGLLIAVILRLTL